MADAIQAECKYNGGKVFDGEYGEYTDAVFTHQGDEVKVYGNKGTDLFDALYELEKGETYTLIDKDGSYKLADSEIETLLGSPHQPNGNNAPATQNSAPHPASGDGAPQRQPQGVAQEPDPQELAKRHARLVANTYVYLDRIFGEQAESINKMPSSSDLQKMAVTSTIEATR